jgi:hypothetical protein
MSEKITFDQIQKVTISDPCMKTSPCKHRCEITLTDGRKKSVSLFSPSIGTLIEKISLEKIDYKGQLEHFPSNRSISWGNWSQHTHIEAEEILNKLFDESINEIQAEEQAPHTTQIQTKDVVKSNTSGFFNRRNMLIIAGAVATVGIALFILSSNYVAENTGMNPVHTKIPYNFTYDSSTTLHDYNPFTRKTTRIDSHYFSLPADKPPEFDILPGDEYIEEVYDPFTHTTTKIPRIIGGTIQLSGPLNPSSSDKTEGDIDTVHFTLSTEELPDLQPGDKWEL